MSATTGPGQFARCRRVFTMSADASDIGNEEAAGSGEHSVGPPSRNRIEVHLHRGFLDIDLCLNTSRPEPPGVAEPTARRGSYQGHHRLAVHTPERSGPAQSEQPRRLGSPPAFRRGAPSSASFWSALSPGEQEQFRGKAERRTFAAGARLMREGEAADHVVVILDGQTEVFVHDHGTERTIAR